MNIHSMPRFLWNEKIAPRIISCCCAQPFITEQRRHIVPQARGRVLELGVGTGSNFPLYVPGRVSTVIGIEPAPVMRSRARAAACSLPVKVKVLDAVGECLPFNQAEFDSVVTTYTLCSVASLAGVLAEVRRVLKPDGTLLFLEHGRSPDARVFAAQRRIEPLWKRALGNCHLTRSISGAIESAGFHIGRHTADYIHPLPRWIGWTECGHAQPG